MRNRFLSVVFLFLCLSVFSSNASDKYPAVTMGVGIGVLDWEFSPHGMAFNPKYQIKIGKSDNTINVVTGVRYRYSSGFQHFGGQFLNVIERSWQKKKIVYTALTSSQLQLPVQVRFNLNKNTHDQWFIGAGVVSNYNFASRIIDKRKSEVVAERIKDPKLVNAFNCEAELQIGRKLGNFELGAYFRYDVMSRYDCKYISETYPDFTEDIMGTASDKWRIGINLIYYFWLN